MKSISKGRKGSNIEITLFLHKNNDRSHKWNCCSNLLLLVRVIKSVTGNNQVSGALSFLYDFPLLEEKNKKYKGNKGNIQDMQKTKFLRQQLVKNDTFKAVSPNCNQPYFDSTLLKNLRKIWLVIVQTDGCAHHMVDVALMDRNDIGNGGGRI